MFGEKRHLKLLNTYKYLQNDRKCHIYRLFVEGEFIGVVGHGKGFSVFVEFVVLKLGDYDVVVGFCMYWFAEIIENI